MISGLGLGCIASAEPAKAFEIVDFGPAKDGYKTIRIKNGMAFVFLEEANTCSEVSLRAQFILEKSQPWLDDRRLAVRRNRASQMYFFQFMSRCRDSKNGPLCPLYYDSFETLGELYKKAKDLKCATDRKNWREPKWPWGAFPIPEGSETQILLIGRRGDLMSYLELIDGLVTDMYYCPAELSSEQVKSLSQKLVQMAKEGRKEGRKAFVAFTQERESVCGENRLPQIVFD